MRASTDEPGPSAARDVAATVAGLVGRALVAAALEWPQAHGYQWISVDFDSGNPLSRPFWLGAGFHPTGYGLVRRLHR